MQHTLKVIYKEFLFLREASAAYQNKKMYFCGKLNDFQREKESKKPGANNLR